MENNKGIEFEKVVAKIQEQIDPNAKVSHDEHIVDKLGHSRQFDVVIRGTFAGQELLGVIECKDLKKKVGTPEVDAFVTKAANINANFKVIVSRKGFTGPAIKEAKHYGIQTLSLISNDEVNENFKVGIYCHADIYYWEQLRLTLLFVDEPKEPITFDLYDVRINNKQVVDWFTNYLLANHESEMTEDWISVGVEFQNNQLVTVSDGETVKCRGLEFGAKRVKQKKQKFVGINGVGFFDWQTSRATLPPQNDIKLDPFQANFMEWEERVTDEFGHSGFLEITFVGINDQFKLIEGAIDLEAL